MGGEVCEDCGHSLPVEASAPVSAFPWSALNMDWLFFGSYDHAARLEVLRLMGITHVLNMVPGTQNLYSQSFIYHVAPSKQPPLADCVQFLENVRSEGGKVLVHCMTGKSRSPTAVAAYLVAGRGLTVEAAVQAVEQASPQAKLTPEHLALLQEFAALWASAPSFAPHA